MTTSEMLASVEAQIRKDIPRLMELREGCLLIKNEKPDNVLEKNEVVKINCICNDIIQVQPIGVLVSRNYTEAQINDLFEIVGHDIMLNDVLEWFKIMRKGFAVCEDGVLLEHEGFDIYRIYPFDSEEDYLIEFDLSTPYLKYQSEELIKFLYEHIKE